MPCFSFSESKKSNHDNKPLGRTGKIFPFEYPITACVQITFSSRALKTSVRHTFNSRELKGKESKVKEIRMNVHQIVLLLWLATLETSSFIKKI